ncbi:MaoC family dehydratase [Chachezhania sediminis]|uniref:MaoC family dehydratase n=1 Tax=Chachezhania sediminis TaxID=2599291 RepID=UPI00131C89D1|nr:MaoC family dehydratase [Chachezhania sediminis]
MTALPHARIAITQPMIDGYARLSGDFNPLHVDPEAAAKTPFGGTIAHGCIPMEPIFQAIQHWLGRPDLPQDTRMSLRYHRPSQPGDTIRLEATAATADGTDGILRVDFACLNQRDETVISGHCTLPAPAA